MIKAGKLDLALSLLETVSFLVSALHEEPPRIAIWVSDDSIVQERRASASALIKKALASLPPGTRVPPGVAQLAEAYRSHAGD
jgi:homoserine kinase